MDTLEGELLSLRQALHFFPMASLTEALSDRGFRPEGISLVNAFFFGNMAWRLRCQVHSLAGLCQYGCIAFYVEKRHGTEYD